LTAAAARAASWSMTVYAHQNLTLPNALAAAKPTFGKLARVRKQTSNVGKCGRVTSARRKSPLRGKWPVDS